MQTILVTGGGGFIGSHTCLVLLEKNFRVIILDSFVNGSQIALRRIKKLLANKIEDLNSKFFIYKGDLRDEEILKKVFEEFSQKKMPIEAVIHFAGLKAVNESFKKTSEYWDVNVKGSLKLFKIMEIYDCKKIIYSSSATVYDQMFEGPLNEKAPLMPSNPYGETKLEVEKILGSLYSNKSNYWNIIILRYFNPIGAHYSGQIGEDPKNKGSNLYPLLIDAALSKSQPLKIYGNDWPNVDGTCIRDFIHVMDLAEAHLESLLHLQKKDSNFLILNVGTGKGTSVIELVNVFEKVNNCKIPIEFVDRREGDIFRSVADNSLIMSTLNWKCKRSLKDMCQDGWKWKRLNPNGYIDL